MPTIFEPKDLPVVEKNGASIATLANQAMLGAGVLQVERITLKPRTATSLYEASSAERFVYVIRGTGQAYVGERDYSLTAESILWLESEDTFSMEAGVDGLEVLLAHAPASE